jgi:hypothetical protein
MQFHRENREAPNWRVGKNVVLVGIHRDDKQALNMIVLTPIMQVVALTWWM